MKNARDLSCTPAVLKLEQDLLRMWRNIKAEKPLAQRKEECPIESVDTDTHEFFAVCVAKGEMTNRTSL